MWRGSAGITNNHLLNSLHFQKPELYIKQEPADISQDVHYDSSDTDYSDADDEDYEYEDTKSSKKVSFEQNV